ncbi:hypothetical protein D3C87_1303280 [compost metagenome]
MELIETQHPAIAEQFIEGDRQGVGLIAVLEHALVQLGEKLMEVQALFLREGNGPEKTVEQPAFAAPHGTMQVKTRKGFRRSTHQHAGMPGHAVDHPLLAVTEGVALGMGLLVKVVVDDLACRSAAGSRCLAEKATQRLPARFDSRTVGRSKGHWDITSGVRAGSLCCGAIV